MLSVVVVPVCRIVSGCERVAMCMSCMLLLLNSLYLINIIVGDLKLGGSLGTQKPSVFLR